MRPRRNGVSIEISHLPRSGFVQQGNAADRRGRRPLIADVGRSERSHSTVFSSMDEDFKNKPIADEFRRWSERFGDEDPYKSERTIGIHEVLRRFHGRS